MRFCFFEKVFDFNDVFSFCGLLGVFAHGHVSVPSSAVGSTADESTVY